VDIDNDGKINIHELTILANYCLDSCVGPRRCGGVDYGQSGSVNIADFALLAKNWQATWFPLKINEFMASNNDTLTDENGDYSDWIEIHNPTDITFNLDGWFLTDDESTLNKWEFPAHQLDANEFLVVFASDKDRAVSGSQLHTNFKLSASGEYLALVSPDGVTIAHEYKPQFPAQLSDISYGLIDLSTQYMTTPTPGQANIGGTLGIVEDVKFSADRGFYETPFSLTLANDTANAAIRYTTDGSEPTATYGSIYNGALISINDSSTIRAIAYRAGYINSYTATNSYIFLDDAIHQPVLPSGFPTNWGYVGPDYEMDPDIVDDDPPVYGPLMESAMLSLPSISIVTDLDHLFGSSGIYSNPTSEGWERPTSVEFIYPDGRESYQVNCGLRIHGGFSRNPFATDKHSFRLLFKDDYGPTKLNYKLFDDEDAVDSFDTIILRANFNDSFAGRYAEQNIDFEHRQNLRDEFMRQNQLAMGQVGSHGNFMHLYVNGLYWGLYNPVERPEASFSASYLGGDKDNWDAINAAGLNVIQVVDGDLNAWNAMLSLCRAGLSGNTAYQRIQGNNSDRTGNPAYPNYLDIENLIDYMLINFWSGNDDWPQNNFYICRDRTDASTGFKFFCWDGELTMGIRSPLENDRTNVSHNISEPYSLLRANAEFRLLFADHIHRHFFNGGVLTSEAAIERDSELADDTELGILCETARWGDVYREPEKPMLDYKLSHWITDRDWILNTYLPQRPAIVLQQLKNASLYPSTVAPIFNINDSYQHGGPITTGAELTMENGGSGSVNLISSGSSWRYLDDGSDQGIAWRYDAYNDNSWAVGSAELGYGDGDETTVVSYGGNSSYKHITTYFRHHFTANNVSNYESLTVKLFRDDGGVIYLNGVEILPRSNMPSGEILYDTFADSVVPEAAWFDYDVNTALLNEGDNLIAVEIHQASRTSSDLSFDLRLIAEIPNFLLSGPAYYTLDGSDPREYLTGNAVGTAYTGPVVLSESVQVKARVKENGIWSALNEATYAVGDRVNDLRITEIMYHPDDPNTEFIELKNIGTETLNLNLVKFTNGVDFTFPSLTLSAGGHVVVVQNETVFNAKYLSFSGVIAGEYTGSLDNGGERIELQDAIGRTIHDFKYKDGWYDITDGDGFSLTKRAPNTAEPNSWSEKDGWRPSVYINGSPCSDDSGILPDPGDIVINELLAHSDTEPNDWIELRNITDSPINISGWYLSDNELNRTKYQIHDGTILGPDGEPNSFIIFDESHFANPADPCSHTQFRFSENGETACLSSHSDSNGYLTGYRRTEDFGASEPDVAFGRYYKASTDSYNFVAMSSNTPGTGNADPKVWPIVIDEIMYNPPEPGFGGDFADNDDFEYIKLYNRTGSSVNLHDDQGNPRKFTDGIEFTFPPDTAIPAGDYIVIAKNPAAFTERYSIVLPFTVFGPFEDGTGLSNGGEKLDLSIPGDMDGDGQRQYIRIDRVNYSDGSNNNWPDGVDPWPIEPDGNGKSLHRISPSSYGNDVANWQSYSPPPVLIRHWMLDETGTDTVADDATGSQNGTLNNFNFDGTSGWTTGQIDGGLRFDGSDDSVSAGSNTLKYSFTITAWIKGDVFSSDRMIFSQYDVSASGAFIFYVANGGKLAAYQNGGLYEVGAAVLNTGQWYHVAFVKNASFGTAYLNGIPEFSATDMVSMANLANIIGAHSSGGRFDGVIDDVRIYSGAMSEAEILELATN